MFRGMWKFHEIHISVSTQIFIGMKCAHDLCLVYGCFCRVHIAKETGWLSEPPVVTIRTLQKKVADPWSTGREELTIKPNSFCKLNEKFQENVAGEIVSVYVQTWNGDDRGRSTSLPSHLDSTFKCHQSACALHDLQGLIINYSTRAPDTIQGL